MAGNVLQVCLVPDYIAETFKIQTQMKKEQDLQATETQALNIPLSIWQVGD